MPAMLARQMLDGLFLICGENKGAYLAPSRLRPLANEALRPWDV